MIYFSELCYLNRPLEHLLSYMEECGADNIELMLDGQYWDGFESRTKEIAKILRSKGFGYSLHPAAWDMNLTSEVGGIRQVTYEHYKNCVYFASEIGADQVVIHPGYCAYPFSRELAKNRAAEAIEKLSVTARPLGVSLALENVGAKQTMLYTFEEFAALADNYGDNVGLLLDIGHAHITAFDIPLLIRKVRERLLGVHIHDNNGIADQHLPIGDGTVDFAPIWAELKKVKTHCHFVLEYNSAAQTRTLQKDKVFLTEILLSD